MFLRIMRTRRHRSVGTPKKCTARKLIASDEAFQKVVNEAMAENLEQQRSEATALSRAWTWPPMMCMLERSTAKKIDIDTETSPLATTDRENAYSSM